jgi:Putative zinc-finger
MDHLEAKRLHASEKYILGDLSADQRDAFEEHYFDCAECAEDVKAALTFVTASRQVFREEPALTPVTPQAPSRRAAWFRPLIAVPALAALVLALGIYIRPAKPPLGVVTPPGQALLSIPSFGLRGGDRLADEKTIIQLRSYESFQLHFDFVPAQVQNFSAYTGELQDASSHVLMQYIIPAERMNKEVNLIVPAGLLRPGDYTFAVFGQDATSSVKAPVGKFLFAVQHIP